MIRRNPTRIELKLEDLNEFEVIQKADKKKSATTVIPPVGGPEAQKLIRQERVGLGATTLIAAVVMPPPASSSSRPTHYRREPMSQAITPPAVGMSAANGSGHLNSSLVVQTPSTFDEFGVGIVADSSTSAPTSSPSTSATPTNDALQSLPNAGSGTPGNLTTSSMEMSLDYLRE